MTYTQKEKKAILSELILMAHADNILKKEELAFIEAVGKRLNLDSDELAYMIKHPEKLDVHVPKIL